jgi:4-amino-4-deoxy-L-arabinose transferase-like glycosyltransferase
MSATVQSASDRHLPRARWLVLALTLLNLFLLLGHRGLNEPDEGRYGEVAREMIERGDWLVPHFWYAPHLSKPPFAYWATAASLQTLGFSEWAVRFPVALAGLSGILAAYCLGRRLAGARAGLWTAVILQTTGLYVVMSRMLTTDIFLTQFVAWAGYFLWRSLDALLEPGTRLKFFGWHLAAWAAMGLGFLCKGPVALVIPLAGAVAWLICQRKEPLPWLRLLTGAALGSAVCAAIAAPWFLVVDRALPGSLHYMIFGQVVGHVLGTVDNRTKTPLFFVAVLALGFLPWTALLGWLWRRKHWRTLTPAQRGGWVFLSAWAGFAFVMFSISSAKLPAYILPIFPPLAALVAARFLAEPAAWPTGLWNLRRVPLFSACALIAGLPIGFLIAFGNFTAVWLWLQLGVGLAGLVVLALVSRYWNVFRCVAGAVAIMLAGCWVLYWQAPTLETSPRGNQTFRQLGAMLKDIHQPGDILLAWKSLPQGLPLYVQSLINPTNRPYLGRLNPTIHPFEFPGNRERFGELILTNAAQVAPLLTRGPRVLAVGTKGTCEELRAGLPQAQVVLLLRSGRWELVELRRPDTR